MGQSGIYRIRNIINEKVYIGSSKQLSKRKSYHLYGLRHNRHSNFYLQAAWNKYGEKNFKFEVVERCEQEYLLIHEQYWIDYYDAANPDKGYNIEPDAIRNSHSQETRKKIGDGNRGKVVSLETRKKQSEALLGEKHPMFRKKLPKEWHDNVVKALIGRVVSEDTRKKLRMENLGKKYTIQPKTIERKQQIANFIKQFGFKPSKWSKDVIERKLGKALSHYLDKNSRQYDFEFAIGMSKFPAWQQFKRLQKEKYRG